MKELLFNTSLSATALGLWGVKYNLSHGPFLEDCDLNPSPNLLNTSLPKVSLLIPVRNELDNIKPLLSYLSKLEYPRLEIIILDDNSTDGTREILEKHQDLAKIIPSSSLPGGWTGKNWACYQLSQYATGDIWIFGDADILPEKNSISLTVAAFNKYPLDAMSCLLKHKLETISEQAILPQIMQIPLLCYLPIDQVRLFSSPRVSAAHGAWIAFKPRTYSKIGGHAAVRNASAEDLDFARLVKQNKMTFGLFLSRKTISIRMYRGMKQTWNGFGRSLPSLPRIRPRPVVCRLRCFP